MDCEICGIMDEYAVVVRLQDVNGQISRHNLCTLHAAKIAEIISRTTALPNANTLEELWLEAGETQL